VVDDGDGIEIAGGRHPVVERALAQAGEGPFVPNISSSIPSAA